MKILIAASGNSMESPVAKRFEHAAWYFIVDGETSFETIQHLTPQDRHHALQIAETQDDGIVVAGKCGESTLRHLRTHHMRFAPTRNLNVVSALEKIKSHDIIPLETDQLQPGQAAMPDGIRRGLSAEKRMKGVHATTGYASDTARGQHHLQQYGGRGH